MTYYRITIYFKNGRKAQGIRQIDLRNIDVVLNMVQKKVNQHYRENYIDKVEVVMLAKQSEEVKKWLRK